MEPYGIAATEQYQLNPSDDWLQKRQGLALPVLPPTTPEACKYFFSKIREFSEAASADGKKKVNFEAFAKEWNWTADEKERFYVTIEVLLSYAKSWEKLSNIRASQELIVAEMQSLAKSKQIFLAEEQPFPAFITSNPVQMQPSRGVLDLQENPIPPSLSTGLAISRPVPPCLTPMLNETAHMADAPLNGEPADGFEYFDGLTPAMDNTNM
jgi:hypothetical protein